MKTKIYGTIGPSCDDFDTLFNMFKSGMTGVRLNLSHGTDEDRLVQTKLIREAADKAGVIPDILIDLRGPELRVGVFPEPIELKEKESVDFERLHFPDCLLSYDKLKISDILLDDGKLLISNGVVIRGGFLKQRKSIKVEGYEPDLPTLTKEDINNINMSEQYGLTGVMQPFVRSKNDLINVRNAISNKNLRIFAKVESESGIRNLKDYLEIADEIVIARGDLGNAVNLCDLPSIQKDISRICIENNKPFMVVTEMLASMVEKRIPTRAEVSDIFNAVYDGASSVMLTNETAAGKYPIEAMTYLVNTVKSAENYIS